MALPTAQLGGMPNMNMPSYIPTVAYQKEPKAWEKALLSLVANAGSQVLSQGVQNAMQQDFAGKYGEAPTTGMQKFFSGPTVNRAESEQRQQMLAKMAGEIGLREMEAQPSARDVFLAREKQNEDSANRALQYRQMLGQFALGREGHATQKDITGMETGSREKVAEAQRTFEAPYRQAQIGELGAQTNRLNADAEKERVMMELQKRMLGTQGSTPDPKTGLTPRQTSVQERAAGKPMPDPRNFPSTQAMPNSYLEPALSSLVSSSAPPENPHSIRDQVLQLRASMPQQDPATQAQTASQIDQLLRRLSDIASGTNSSFQLPYNPAQ